VGLDIKPSEMTAEYLAKYLRIAEPTEDELQELYSFLSVAKAYITGYTGQEDLDKHTELGLAALVLVGDMYENRAYNLESGAVSANRFVENILEMYRINQL
jgi:uncharacterized phage protein (predicted DNA packaging)